MLIENLTNIEKHKENKNNLSHHQRECHSFDESRKKFRESEVISEGLPSLRTC